MSKNKQWYDNLKSKGYWWLAETNKIPGILKGNAKEGFELELLGGFNNTFIPNGIKERFKKNIYGEDLSGNKYILKYNSLVKKENTSETYRTQEILEDVYLYDEDSLEFTDVFFELSLLESWILIRPKEEDGLKIDITPSCYKDDYTVNLYVPKRAEKNADYGRVSFEIGTKNKTLDKSSAMKIIYEIRAFFSFLFDYPLHVLEVDFYNKNKLKVDEKFGDSEFKIPFKVRNVFSYSRDKIDEIESGFSIRPVFDFEGIKDFLPSLIESWYQKKPKYEEVINFYFEHIFNQTLSIDLSLLTIVHCLEGFHRRYSGVDDMYLQTRIKKLIKLHKSEIRKFNNNNKLQQIVNTRHLYDHLFFPDKDILVSNQEKRLVFMELKMLLKLCLLKELGMDNKLTSMFVSSSEKFYEQQIQVYDYINAP